MKVRMLGTTNEGVEISVGSKTIKITAAPSEDGILIENPSGGSVVMYEQKHKQVRDIVLVSDGTPIQNWKDWSLIVPMT